jgi:hypothetical protein
MVATISPKYTYLSTIKAAQRINWQIDDLIGHGKELDFSKSFLPESLANTQNLACLNSEEKLLLNQIRGNSYLHLFGLVEEFIFPLVIDHVKFLGCEDIYATQAFLGFAEEESKHIHLFRRFAEEFARGFGTRCECIGPAKPICETILAHSALGVALITLHIEWMTQRHYLESVINNQQENLDPLFSSLLKHHWLEEAQHAKLDTLMVENLVNVLDKQQIEQGIEDYLHIVQILHQGLQAQVDLDIESLARATQRQFTDAEVAAIKQAQIKSYEWTFLASGMLHDNFRQTISEISPAAEAIIVALARQFV